MSFDASGEYVPDPEPVECETCGGSGQVPRGYGRSKFTEPCGVCLGNGVVEPCP